MISAVLIVNNEADNLPRCLTAIQKIASEIIVVDHESTDQTKLVAEEYGAIVYQRKWKGYAAGKNFGNQQAINNWILSIDADEILSEELILNIKELSLEDKSNVYALDRANYFGDQWVKYCGWYPDWKIRLFHKDAAKWEGDYVHERLRFSEKITPIRLEGKLKHFSYQSDQDHLKRIERYAQLAAEKMLAENKKPNLLKEKLSPFFRFFRTYVLKRGFLDGALGWKISTRNSQMIKRKFEIFRQLKSSAK